MLVGIFKGAKGIRMNKNDLKIFDEPFAEKDVEWRVGNVSNNQKISCKVLCYLTNRAIMNRLDKVCGKANWKNEYKAGPQGGVLCGISILIDGDWITKWDGAENSNIEAVKGGLSDSMKRCAVQWGMGRYLYNLGETWGIVVEKGQGKYTKTKGIEFYWKAPPLPAWALPKPFNTELFGVFQKNKEEATNVLGEDFVRVLEEFEPFNVLEERAFFWKRTEVQISHIYTQWNSRIKTTLFIDKCLEEENCSDFLESYQSGKYYNSDIEVALEAMTPAVRERFYIKLTEEKGES